MVVARRRQGGILQLPCSLGFRLAFSATGGARLPQFAKVVARRRQGGILQLPCSLGFRLAFSATGGARLRPPAAFKKAGENWLENFSGFPAECAGPPLIGSGGLGFFIGSRGGKGWWMDRLGRWKFQRTGGGGGGGRRQGAKRPERASPGPLAPASLFCLAGRGAALGPPLAAKRRRPPAGPRVFTYVKKARQKPGLTVNPATPHPPPGKANFYADSIVFSGEFPYSRR